MRTWRDEFYLRSRMLVGCGGSRAGTEIAISTNFLTWEAPVPVTLPCRKCRRTAFRRSTLSSRRRATNARRLPVLHRICCLRLLCWCDCMMQTFLISVALIVCVVLLGQNVDEGLYAILVLVTSYSLVVNSKLSQQVSHLFASQQVLHKIEAG